MRTPVIHLICNAHLDPVWQWRWEEGCGEALSTFGNAVAILHEHDGLIFNHNEAVLYQWVQRYDPPLFKQIQKLVRQGRWCISGGWYLQPDANMPGTESLIRHILEGRRFFELYFDARPTVAYNFDSFGHSGGLPQILRLADYKMYIHMRPQEPDLKIPSDLYRWRGVDGSEILTYRIAVGLYHTERDNIEQRLEAGTELALRLNRDVPLFWGIGNHGGGATREDLEKIGAFMKKEKRVRIIHSTPEQLYAALKKYAANCPIVEGDLQRIFTGCYTSLARLKRGAVKSLGEMIETEALSAAQWWINKKRFPEEELHNAWRDHLFNDFHDILPGSCTEPAERDALEMYGQTSQTLRKIKISCATFYSTGKKKRLYIPVTVLNTNPSPSRVPIEVECMLDLRPKWSGLWHLELFDIAGNALPCQEEQPESLLPFNGWRRKICFIADLPQVGASHYEIKIAEGEPKSGKCLPALQHTVDPSTGLVDSLQSPSGQNLLTGLLARPIVVNDDGDSWGSDRWSYRDVLGKFEPVKDTMLTVHDGPIRKITETVLTYNKSKIIQRSISYAHRKAIELHLRIHWNEEHKRLKLSFPTIIKSSSMFCEVPGGAIHRPSDGQEHVHGRWCFIESGLNGKQMGFGIANSGQHGIDYLDGEIRLSVLRSAAYCHEQGFPLGNVPSRKYMDQGVHDIRLLITAGERNDVLKSLPGFADWLAAPPAVYAHLPIGSTVDNASFITIDNSSIRLLSCNQSRNEKALMIRLQETIGQRTKTAVVIGHKRIILSFHAFQIITLKINRNGTITAVSLIDER